MGLALYQNNKRIASWAYSGFMSFRTRLAKAIGIELNQMKGYGGNVSWSAWKDNPLVHLLNHSDCAGSLPANPALGKALREIVSQWSDDENCDESYDKNQALKLAKALENIKAGAIKFS